MVVHLAPAAPFLIVVLLLAACSDENGGGSVAVDPTTPVEPSVIASATTQAAPNRAVDATAAPERTPTSEPTAEPTPTLIGKIAFTSNRDGNNEVYVVNEDGSGLTNLTQNPANDRMGTWSPDGSRIAFVSDRDGIGDVYLMNADGSSPVNLTKHPAFDQNPVWSPDGTHIAFVSNRDGDSEIYVMNADGSELTNVSNNPETISSLRRPSGQDELPTWSPDGTQIAFRSTRVTPAQAVVQDVYVVNADGSEARSLAGVQTADVVFSAGPAWSPKSSDVVFGVGMNPLSASGVPFALQLAATNDPGTVSTLTDGSSHENSPVWSPNGSRIAFRSFDLDSRDLVFGPSSIEVIDLDGTARRALTDRSAANGSPTWSPDSGRIAFVSNRDGNNDVYLMNADGSELTNLTSHPANDIDVAWAPAP